MRRIFRVLLIVGVWPLSALITEEDIAFYRNQEEVSPVWFGAQLGFGRMSASADPDLWVEVSPKYRAFYGLQAGFSVNRWLGFQIEFNRLDRGNDVRIVTNEKIEYEILTHQISLQTIGFLWKGFYAAAGPSYDQVRSFTLVREAGTGAAENFRESLWGINLAAGYTLGSWHAELRYNYGLTNIAKSESGMEPKYQLRDVYLLASVHFGTFGPVRSISYDSDEDED